MSDRNAQLAYPWNAPLPVIDPETFGRAQPTALRQAIQSYINEDIANLGTIKEADLEAVMACEDEFGIEIDPESNPKTVGEFVELVEKTLEQ